MPRWTCASVQLVRDWYAWRKPASLLSALWSCLIETLLYKCPLANRRLIRASHLLLSTRLSLFLSFRFSIINFFIRFFVSQCAHPVLLMFGFHSRCWFPCFDDWRLTVFSPKNNAHRRSVYFHHIWILYNDVEKFLHTHKSGIHTGELCSRSLARAPSWALLFESITVCQRAHLPAGLGQSGFILATAQGDIGHRASTLSIHCLPG